MIKIYSWNINGIRAVINKGSLKSFIATEQPDILCLQELKAKPEQVSIMLPGYEQFWYSADKPGYSGTAIFTKLQPIQVVNGFPRDIIEQLKVSGDIYGDPNLEGRIVAAEFAKFWVISVYNPNAKEDLSRLKLIHQHWNPALLQYYRRLEQTKPVVICGDLNVAHTELDLANPQSNLGKKGFTDEERADFQALIAAGLIDTFRLFKQGNGYYTWWSHFANARERNVGWRIDYILVSNSLKSIVKAADIHPQITGSDHCPVSAVLDY